jgi:hypothetical protein
VSAQHISFTLNLRDVLRNVVRHTQGDLARLAETLLLIVEGRDWEKYELPSLLTLVERSPQQGGCGVSVTEIIAYIRVSMEFGRHDASTQQALEALVELLEAPTKAQRGQRRRRRSERTHQLLQIDNVRLLAETLQQTLTPSQLSELIHLLDFRSLSID